MHPGILLIAGLGNPGREYAATRHNAGWWLLSGLQQQYRFTLSPAKKFPADIGRFTLDGRTIRVAAPTRFMNHSGQAVAAIADFYRIAAKEILILHDELDLAAGTVRVKLDGGHGGHNGLRNVIEHLGARDFVRIRIGIGHPGTAAAVTDYALSRPSSDDRSRIEHALERTLPVMPDLINGHFDRAMQQLHTESVEAAQQRPTRRKPKAAGYGV